MFAFSYADYTHFEENFSLRKGRAAEHALSWSAERAATAATRAVEAAHARVAVASLPFSNGEIEKLSCVDVRGDQLILWLYGPVSSFSEQITRALIEHADKAAILLRIDSCGGSLAFGVDLARCIRNHRARKLAVIDRACWSAAVLPAVACDRVFIRQGASMMVHRCARAAYGNADELIEAARQIRQSDEESKRFIAHCRRRRLRISLNQLWSNEEFLSSHEAVAFGLADRVIHALPFLSYSPAPEGREGPPVAFFL